MYAVDGNIVVDITSYMVMWPLYHHHYSLLSQRQHTIKHIQEHS